LTLRASRVVRSVLGRARSTVGTLLSRDIAVLTNAIAFNFLLCLFPLLLVIAATSQQLPGGRGRAGTAVLLLLDELIPFGHDAFAESLKNLTRMARGLEAFSLLLIVWGSSGIFMPVEMALNHAWGGRPARSFLRSRGLAFGITLLGGVIALLSIALTVAARSYRDEWPTIAEYAAKASAFLLTFLLFFVIYRFVPAGVSARVALRAALWAGTAWEIVKYLFVINLGRSNLEAFYGPLAFAVSLILWAYVSSLVLVFGALMTPRKERSAP
jgi:membrane protein/epoxyqueuosine reductase